MSIKAVFYFNDNTVTVHSENAKSVTDKFEPGYYITSLDGQGNLRIRQDEFKEVHKPFPNQKAGQVIDTINKFLERKNLEACNEMGFTYKLNTLLYGKQGVGKTAILNYIAHNLMVNHNALVFRVDDFACLESSWALCDAIRKIQDNPIVFVVDEFDRYCSGKDESYIKNLLDGNRSINNTLVLAATNYLDRIPSTIKERPSRFRIVAEILPITDKSIIRNLISDIHSKVTVKFLTEEQIENIVQGLTSTTVDEVKTILMDALMNVSLDLPETAGMGFAKDKGDGSVEETDEFRELIKNFENIKKKSIPELSVYADMQVTTHNPHNEVREVIKRNGLYNHKSGNEFGSDGSEPRPYMDDGPMSEGSY